MKSQIRKELLEKRSVLSAETVEHKSQLIFQRLKTVHFYNSASYVMLYISFRNEVRTSEIIKDLFRHGKRVFIPVTVPKTKELIVSELIDVEKDLEIGHFGVLEPKKDAIRPVEPQILDFIIVPGVGFDSRGYRIGYGGGYYDRFLPQFSSSVPTVSLAFELQIIDKVPTDSYDYPVQYIVTEERIIQCQRGNS